MDLVIWGAIALVVVLFFVGMKFMKWISWGVGIAVLGYVGYRLFFGVA